MEEALVISARGSWYTIRNQRGEFLEARLRGVFRLHGSKSTSPVVVGDRALYNTDGGDVIIHELLERKNYVVRRSVNLSKQTHILAANVDYAFLLVTLALPETSTAFIDRFLAACTAYDINAMLLFNKTDIYDGQLKEMQQAYAWLYERAGYSSLIVSAKTGQGIDRLKELMKGSVSMFAGHSGTGKSTLINAMEPGLNLKTNEISESHRQGQHTTTFAQMHELGFGGYVIDTPGIKGFGLPDVIPEEIDSFFPDIFQYKGRCRYYNCLHDNEPDCGVKGAVELGDIAESRYASYLGILHDDEAPYR